MTMPASCSSSVLALGVAVAMAVKTHALTCGRGTIAENDICVLSNLVEVEGRDGNALTMTVPGATLTLQSHGCGDGSTAPGTVAGKTTGERLAAMEQKLVEMAEDNVNLRDELSSLKKETASEFTGEVMVNGDMDTCYPIYFDVNSQGTERLHTLKMYRHYNDQSPDDWTTTTHHPSLFLEVDFLNTHWGGIDEFLEIKSHIWQYHQTVCKVELAQPRRDGLVVWVVGGDLEGIVYQVETNFPWQGVTSAMFEEGMKNGEALYRKTYNYVYPTKPEYNRFVEPVSYSGLVDADQMLPHSRVGLIGTDDSNASPVVTFDGKFVVHGNTNTCYPVVFTMSKEEVKVHTLKLHRTYQHQAPDDLNLDSTHKPAVYFEVDVLKTNWGGIDEIVEVKRHVWMYHQSICKIEYMQPKRNGIVVWVVGGGETGISFAVEANFAWKGVTNPYFGAGLVNGEAAYEKVEQYIDSNGVHASQWVEPENYEELKASPDWLAEKKLAYE